MNANVELPKICPSCRATDVTSFSKCRFCGTRYDAVIARPSPLNLDERFIGISAIIVMFVGGFIYLTSSMQQARAEKLKPVSQQVQASNRPHVYEFYANWCGPCRSYGPTVDACSAKYSGQIDFKRLNVDEPGSRELAMSMEVRAIPRTVIFDRHGKEVASFTGGVSAQQLDQYMQSVLSQ